MNKNKQKQRKNRQENWLTMDSIFASRKPEVLALYRQIIKEEEALAQVAIERDEMWNVNDYINRLNMRMGVAFFHMLSARNKAFFMRDYPNAFILYGPASGTSSLAVAM